ncbi:homoserine O-acetyltransferase [Natrialba magadii ATCC 43099]|uniref:Homoserine O-acetyltransferase n=1 Tax=Natrialba magadii (strain ATCC 43099 / DSM 3394 / CCM 3739 / CIP 104546 / IAM 13178 / JCM 8861 / NBRC 102185 / NCIMB 2190 / MS3) TaxID=547559 RepID=D3SV48_NATMM|nr:homoserine O-acetyltransferase [Natrialba magadii]ADD05456.1 homoserine O-acetyltransferase [Natrialba magadii ATCC 43099]ELY29230.1 homoserine O-acetyltransferase [Natrialba magadii ATCC 43099]
MTTTDVQSLGEFTFECGESIPELEVAYETYGEFTGDNAVLVCHALTGSAHVARRPGAGDDTAGQARAWWGDVVGPGKAVDTTEYYVVCANVPGSCYGTTGPSSTNPETGEPYGTDFPPVTIGDWTRTQRRLLDELGVGRLHTLIGGSVGGMNVLDWLSRYPDDVERAAAVATAARLDAQCLALDTVARRAITSDPNWNGGHYYGGPVPEDGLARARQIGHIMYLSKASMAQKFGRRSAGRETVREESPDPAASFFPYREVESYLDYQAEKFTDRFDANSYLYLTRAMDDYDLSTGYESDAAALAAFEGELLLLSFTGDWHFTVEQSEAVAEACREAGVDVSHHVVESDHGHDAFLVEPEKVGPPLATVLEEGLSGRTITDTTDGEKPTGESESFAPVHTSLFSK